MPSAISKGMNVKFESTIRVFNTVYIIVKKSKPFTDLAYDIELQKLNGIDMGRILHSDHSCANISSHVATEMKLKVTNYIIKNDIKISI